MKKKRYEPTFEVASYKDITPTLLQAHGIRGLISDVDDTLVPHGQRTPTPELLAWLETMRAAGIPVCLISNNHYPRVSAFADPLRLPFLHDAMKPRTHCLDLACGVLNVPKDAVALLGDQIMTDWKAADRFGIRSVLVNPVTNGGGWFVRMKRRWERIRYGRVLCPKS